MRCVARVTCLVYINDTDDVLPAKFADDTKLLRGIGIQADCDELQKDLHTMYMWSDDWQLDDVQH